MSTLWEKLTRHLGGLFILAAGVTLVALSPATSQVHQLGVPILRDGTAKRTHGLRRVQIGAPGWIDTTIRAAVQEYYNNVLVPTANVPIEWTGNVITGVPGTTSQAFRDAAVTQVNWFRAMAGVPASVSFDPIKNSKAQQAALMMSANRALDHTPPTSWIHYTAEGAEAAGNSNLCLASYNLDPGCVSLYMRDSGVNNTAVGHRRWILYPQTQIMGTGDVARTGDGPDYYPAANALWVFDSNYGAPRPPTRNGFVAWPPPGYVPLALFYPRWSFSYPGANFSGSSVTLTRGGVNLPVQLETVSNGYGENTLVWVVSGPDLPQLPLATDSTYSVTVHNVVIGGVADQYSYEVVAFNPAGRPDKVGLFRHGFFWLLDENANHFFDGVGAGLDRAFPLGGLPGDIPVSGDWNGDGKDEGGFYRNGAWYLDWNGDDQFTGSDRIYFFGGVPGDRPVVGDWNNDGADDVGVFRNGFFWILDSDGNGQFNPGSDVTTAFGGVPGDVPVVGDWDGDGATEIGLVRLGFYWLLDKNGNFMFDGAGPGNDLAFPFGGLPGDIPVVGDWNSNGTSDVGVFRLGFFWLLDQNENHAFDGKGLGQDAAFAFGGLPNDVPVVGAW